MKIRGVPHKEVIAFTTARVLNEAKKLLKEGKVEEAYKYLQNRVLIGSEVDPYKIIARIEKEATIAGRKTNENH